MWILLAVHVMASPIPAQSWPSEHVTTVEIHRGLHPRMLPYMPRFASKTVCEMAWKSRMYSVLLPIHPVLDVAVECQPHMEAA